MKTFREGKVRDIQSEIVARSLAAAAEHVYARIREGETAGYCGEELIDWLAGALKQELYSEPLSPSDFQAISRRWDELDNLLGIMKLAG